MVLGNLIQINARGEQERLLYGNPQMTYFKKVFNSPSNFARSYHNIPYSGTPNFGDKIHINIPLNGDLLANLFLSLELPKINEVTIGGSIQNLNNEKGISYYCNGVGYKLIKSIELKFNGVSVEKLTGEMCAHIFNYQFTEYDNNLINNVYKLNKYTDYEIIYGSSDTEQNMKDYERRGPINLRLPIPFFFSQSSDNYLPLCAMSNTNIEVILEIENIDNLIIGNSLGGVVGNTVDMDNIPSINNFKIINEVINLDDREKKLFKLNELNYLVKLNTEISEDTIDGNTKGNITIDINARHATEAIYMSVIPDINSKFNDHFNYSINYLTKETLSTQPTNLYEFYTLVKRPLTFNSHNNFIIDDISIETDNSKIFEIGTIDLPMLINNMLFNKCVDDNYYQLAVYPFNLSCKSLSGSLNFSRVVKKTLNFKVGSSFRDYLNNKAGYNNMVSLLTNDYNKITIKCYSCYFNYLIIKNGLAGLKYN